MDSGPFRDVLLVGATGAYSFGQAVVFELSRKRESFGRIGVYHDTSRQSNATREALLRSFKEAGIEIVTGSGFDDPDAFKGFDCVMSFLGNSGLHLQPKLIDTAIAAGVRHFYPSEYGADILVGENWTQRYYVDKVKTRQHLERRELSLPDLGWTYVLLGRLMEWSVTSHFGFDNRAATAKIYGTSQGRQSMISGRDAAAYIVRTLLDPLPGTAMNRRSTYRFSQSSPTYAEIFNILEKVTGRAYQVEYLDVKTAQIEEKVAKENGDVDAELSASHKLIQGREGTLLPLPWDNEKFPDVAPADLEDTLTAAFASNKLRRAYGLEAI